jgi:hypothetical protein
MESGDIGLLTGLPPTPADMLLGPEGQRVLEKSYYGSATKNQPFKRRRPERGLTTEKYEKEVVYWETLLKKVGREIVGRGEEP